DGLLVGQVGGLAVDHQRVVDLAALDHAAGDVHAVDEGEAGVGDVEVLAGVGQAEVAGHDRRGRWLEVVAADRGVDQQADLVGVDARIGQRLDAGQGGGIGGEHVAVVPEPAGVDAGDVTQNVGPDAQAIQGRLEPGVDLVRAQPARRVDVGQAGNGDVLEQHEQRPERQRSRQINVLPGPLHYWGLAGVVQPPIG